MSTKTFIVGDTHFFHKNIIDYCNRPFASVEEMNEYLVNQWNATVGKFDRVIVNGDFALGGKDYIIEVGKRLNGKKTLILGNHDRASLNTYYEAGFEMVIDHPLVLEDFFIVSHQPMHVQSNGLYANVFAHVHDDPKYVTVSSRSFCTSVERHGYKPVDFEEIKAAMAECEKEMEDNG